MIRKFVLVAAFALTGLSLSACYRDGRPGHDSDHHHGHHGDHDGDHHYN